MQKSIKELLEKNINLNCAVSILIRSVLKNDKETIKKWDEVLAKDNDYVLENRCTTCGKHLDD